MKSSSTDNHEIVEFTVCFIVNLIFLFSDHCYIIIIIHILVDKSVCIDDLSIRVVLPILESLILLSRGSSLNH